MSAPATVSPETVKSPSQAVFDFKMDAVKAYLTSYASTDAAPVVPPGRLLDLLIPLAAAARALGGLLPPVFVNLMKRVDADQVNGRRTGVQVVQSALQLLVLHQDSMAA